MNFEPEGTTVNSDYDTETRTRFRQVRSTGNVIELLPLHDSTRQPKSVRTIDAITGFGCTVLLNSHYSPYHAPSHWYLIGPLGKA